MSQIYRASITGGDSVEVVVKVVSNNIIATDWTLVGREELYAAAQTIKPQILGDAKKIPIPSGQSPEQLLLRELILKIRGEWGEEPSDPELCHCRKIPQSQVERAIILGAHTVEKVRQRCSANTGCGTCMPEVEALLKKYLG